MSVDLVTVDGQTYAVNRIDWWRIRCRLGLHTRILRRGPDMHGNEYLNCTDCGSLKVRCHDGKLRWNNCCPKPK